MYVCMYVCMLDLPVWGPHVYGNSDPLNSKMAENNFVDNLGSYAERRMMYLAW
jgi:hypothetical protein